MAQALVVNQLTELFAGKTIEDHVKNFDFSKINVRDESKDTSLTVKLAPAFGKNLTLDAVHALDEELKVMILTTTKELAKLPYEKRSWENITSIMQQNPMLEPDPKFTAISRPGQYLKNGTNAFKFDGSPDPHIVQEVDTWFKEFIGDRDILEATSIDIKVLADIVAQTGATITSFETFFAKNETHRKSIIDVGVLRYPDLDNPYFKLYRIKLDAWSSSSRVLFVQEDHNGIMGQFDCKRYIPRASTMANIDPKLKEKAATEAENMLKGYLDL